MIIFHGLFSSGIVVEDQLETESRATALENDTYHNTFNSPFSVSDDSEGVSSGSCSSAGTPSPRDQEQQQEDRRTVPGIIDRLRSGVVTTRGFERF